MLEIETTDAFAEEDVEVVVVEDFEAAVVALQDVEAVVMERVGLGVFGRGAGELDALLHLSGGVLGVSEREDFFGLGVALVDEAGEALGQDAGLARACARDDE